MTHGLTTLVQELRGRGDELSVIAADRLERQAELLDSGWQPIETAPSHKFVFIFYKNGDNKDRIVKARYVTKFSEEDFPDEDMDESFLDYDREADQYYLPEGWYEFVDNDPNCDEIPVIEGVPTHWTPLFEPPKED